MRCQLQGRFLIHALGAGWRLSREEPHPIDIYLRIPDGADGGAALGTAHVEDIGIEWRAASVVVTLTSAGLPVTLNAHSALVHAPLPQLYDALPLGRFDAHAARFWRRVFWLIRIPGGRRLIGALARCSRGGD